VAWAAAAWVAWAAWAAWTCNPVRAKVKNHFCPVLSSKNRRQSLTIFERKTKTKAGASRFLFFGSSSKMDE
jgi:hypothetical protein